MSNDQRGAESIDLASAEAVFRAVDGGGVVIQELSDAVAAAPDAARPGPGARGVSALSGCAAPIDFDRRCTACGRPALLDAFCCQGGAGMGYHRAGFCVTGVDIDPQPRYPFAFVRADAVAFIAEHGAAFAAIHTSPPCQRYSLCQRIRSNDHPDLIKETRLACEVTGRPYVIENVEDARPELRNPVTLCGVTFGLNTYRHRLFETSFPLVPTAHRSHAGVTVKMGRPLQPGDFYHAVGNFSNVPYVRDDMGVPWMSRDGIRESIPPAYTEHVGAALATHLAETEEVVA